MKNSISFNRCSVLTIETRPDSINKSELDFIISLGITKIELGVQSFSDIVLSHNRRNYTFEDVIAATKDCKLRGLKVGYHIMIGLPFSNIDEEVELFNKHLWKECRPDYLKIYPFAFMGNKYHSDSIANFQYEQNIKYKYNQAIINIKENVPKYARISRIGRQIDAGFSINRDSLSKKTNCKCIKCREPYFDQNIDLNEKQFIVDKSDNGDVYVNCLIPDKYIIGIARLFVCKDRNLLLIREVKVFGASASIGDASNIQGRKIGSELVNEALKYARKENIQNVEVLSSFGSLEFFIKLGFKRNNDGNPNLLFADRKSYYIGITEEDYEHVSKGKWEHVMPKFGSMDALALEVLEKLYISELYTTTEHFKDFVETKSTSYLGEALSTHKPYEIKKSAKYRLGSGVYFVYDNFVIAYKYAKQKQKNSGSKMVILEVNLDSILDNSRYVYNLSTLDGQYKFFKKSIDYKKDKRIFLKQFLCLFKTGKNGLRIKAIIQAIQKALPEINMDALIMDIITKYDNNITGTIAIIQETQLYKPYSNTVFNTDDNKTIRKIGWFTPYDHIEAVIYKESFATAK